MHHSITELAQDSSTTSALMEERHDGRAAVAAAKQRASLGRCSKTFRASWRPSGSTRGVQVGGKASVGLCWLT